MFHINNKYNHSGDGPKLSRVITYVNNISDKICHNAESISNIVITNHVTNIDNINQLLKLIEPSINDKEKLQELNIKLYNAIKSLIKSLINNKIDSRIGKSIDEIMDAIIDEIMSIKNLEENGLLENIDASSIPNINSETLEILKKL